MPSIVIKGEKGRQYAEIEGNSAIRAFRITEKKPAGKKRKWEYIPGNKKEGYDKTI